MAGTINGPDELLRDLREIINQARSLASKSIHSLQVVANYLIGMRIVEEEQDGRAWASYGKETLKQLSLRLALEFGRGYSHRNLEYMRKFYLAYREHVPISQTLSAKLPAPNTAARFSHLKLPSISRAISKQLPLSWSHYLFLLGITNQPERQFYEIEAANANWSLRDLKRQFDSCLYERLALGRDQDRVETLSTEGDSLETAADMLKDPCVLEFLGLDDLARYSESDLETAIINQLQNFLLEMGKGFLFETRQKRITIEEDHFYVDLVFYNRLLRCYVLFDLKLGELTHQDLGQMQMYVNYFDRYIKSADEQPTVGVVLCKKKKDMLVEITLPKGANIHAKKYQTYLPDKEELRKQLEYAQAEWEVNYPRMTYYTPPERLG